MTVLSSVCYTHMHHERQLDITVLSSVRYIHIYIVKDNLT